MAHRNGRSADDWQSRYDAGNALYNLGHYRQAIEEFRRCTALNPGFAWGHGNLSGALAEVGKYEEALVAVDAALALTPGDVDFIASKRDILVRLRRRSIVRAVLALVVALVCLNVKQPGWVPWAGGGALLLASIALIRRILAVNRWLASSPEAADEGPPGTVAVVSQPAALNVPDERLLRVQNLEQATQYLADELRAGRVSILFGAGLSKDSGLPLAAELVSEILTAAGASLAERELVRASGLPFEAFMDAVADHADMAPLWKVFEQGSPNPHHDLLAALVGSGRLPRVYTTNFDRMLELAYAGTPGLEVVVDGGIAAARAESSRPTLVKIHGCISDPASIAVSMRQVASKGLGKGREAWLQQLFSDGEHESVLLLGYSASDAFDILPAVRSLRSPKGVVWVQHTLQGSRVLPLQESGAARFGERVRGIAVDCDTATLTSELARLLDVPLKASGGEPCWHQCVANWAAEARRTNGPSFGSAILGRVLVDAMRPDLALQHWQAAVSALSADESNARRGALLQGLGSTLANCGFDRQGHEYLAKALVLLRAGADRRQEARCLCDIAQNHADSQRFKQAAAAYGDGLAIAEQIADFSLLARSSNGLGGCFASLGELHGARTYLEDAVRHSEEIGDKTSEGVARVNLAKIYRMLGDRASASASRKAGIDILEAAVGSDNHLLAAARASL